MTRDDDISIIEVDDLDLTFEPRPWPFVEAYARDAEAHWQRLAAVNPLQFNGPVLVLHSWSLDRMADGRLILSGAFLETDYKSFVAWRDLGLPDGGARNCFAMAALRASDGAFLIGEMNTFTTMPGRLQFPAGTPDLDDVRGDRVDLDASVFRELEEETGLGRADVVSEPGWTLVIEGRRIACLKRMLVNSQAEDVVARVAHILATQTHPELARLHAVYSIAECDAVRMPPFMVAYLRSATDAA